MSQDLYIPSGAVALKEDSVIRLALQGDSGKGKTWSALTFPNPVVLDFDNNLQAFAGRTDITRIPFCEDAFVDKICPRTMVGGSPTKRPNRKDALIRWLAAEGPKLKDSQSLLMDSWSRVQDGFDIQEDAVPTRNSQGQIDSFAFWKHKIDFSRDLCELLGTLQCNVVVTFHEQFITDDQGKVLFNKIQPLMQGKFVNKLSSYFSDWLRCLYFSKGTDLSKEQQLQTFFKESGIAPVLTQDLGLWQTKSDLAVSCKSRVPGCPSFIPAHYGCLIDLYSKSQAKNNLAPST